MPLSFFLELSRRNYLFCFFTLQIANGFQPGLNPTLLCPAVIAVFKRKAILWNAVRAHACRTQQAPPAEQVNQILRPASAATFQPGKLLLSNCYLSNRSTRHLGRVQTRACSHETLNQQTFDLSLVPKFP